MIGFSSALQNTGPGAIDRNASASLLASESEETLTGRSASGRSQRGVPAGLIALNLEGNDIGDRGAEAIATMI